MKRWGYRIQCIHSVTAILAIGSDSSEAHVSFYVYNHCVNKSYYNSSYNQDYYFKRVTFFRSIFVICERKKMAHPRVTIYKMLANSITPDPFDRELEGFRLRLPSDLTVRADVPARVRLGIFAAPPAEVNIKFVGFQPIDAPGVIVPVLLGGHLQLMNLGDFDIHLSRGLVVAVLEVKVCINCGTS